MPRIDVISGVDSVEVTFVAEAEEAGTQVATFHAVNPTTTPFRMELRQQYSVRDPERPGDWDDPDGDGVIVWTSATIPAGWEGDVAFPAGLAFALDSPYYGDEYLTGLAGGDLPTGGELGMCPFPQAGA